MGKLGLQKIDSEALVKKQPNQPATPQKRSKKTDKSSTISKIAIKHSAELVALLGDIIHGKIEITHIEAQTDAQVRLIAADMKKIWEETNARINEMEANGRVWADKFEKKHNAVLNMIQRIEMHPEWSDETRHDLIDTIKELIKEG